VAAPATPFFSTGLQWTKLRRGATLQCNVDLFHGVSLTVQIPDDTQSDVSSSSE
jgi:hypothetical protein